MKKHPNLYPIHRIIIVLVLILLGIVISATWQHFNKPSDVSPGSFEKCAAAGNPVEQSYPARCTQDGVTYTDSSR